MELEKQVCSLKLAQKLKKLGVRQSSLWHWLDNGYVCWHESPEVVEHAAAAAFTVSELGEMLPESIPNSEPLKMNKGLFGYGKSAKHQWQCMYYDVHYINADTEADARAKMLIYLLERGLMPPNGGSIGDQNLHS